MPRTASVLDYPTRPALIVGLHAGSGSDIIARLIGQWLSKNWVSRSLSKIALALVATLAEAVVHAPPDGYTLLLVVAAGASVACMFTEQPCWERID